MHSRDCSVLDYTEGYISGPDAVSADDFAPPEGIESCVPIAAAAATVQEGEGGAAGEGAAAAAEKEKGSMLLDDDR
jgi:hypothetical protein